MQFNNDTHRYGVVSRLFHWGMALLLGGLFALGWYMTEIDYYHPWYKSSFDLHKSLGILAFPLALMRIGWVFLSPAPPLSREMAPWERLAAKAGHLALYGLLILIPVSGYLISTAAGHGVPFFGLFEIPALYGNGGDGEALEEIAGRIHHLFAFGGAWLVLLHALAALKHHFIDRDDTLLKMAGKPRKPR